MNFLSKEDLERSEVRAQAMTTWAKYNSDMFQVLIAIAGFKIAIIALLIYMGNIETATNLQAIPQA